MGRPSPHTSTHKQSTHNTHNTHSEFLGQHGWIEPAVYGAWADLAHLAPTLATLSFDAGRTRGGWPPAPFAALRRLHATSAYGDSYPPLLADSFPNVEEAIFGDGCNTFTVRYYRFTQCASTGCKHARCLASSCACPHTCAHWSNTQSAHLQHRRTYLHLRLWPRCRNCGGCGSAPARAGCTRRIQSLSWRRRLPLRLWASTGVFLQFCLCACVA